jgi:hypothetical protein
MRRNRTQSSVSNFWRKCRCHNASRPMGQKWFSFRGTSESLTTVTLSSPVILWWRCLCRYSLTGCRVRARSPSRNITAPSHATKLLSICTLLLKNEHSVVPIPRYHQRTKPPVPALKEAVFFFQVLYYWDEMHRLSLTHCIFKDNQVDFVRASDHRTARTQAGTPDLIPAVSCHANTNCSIL